MNPSDNDVAMQARGLPLDLASGGQSGRALSVGGLAGSPAIGAAGNVVAGPQGGGESSSATARTAAAAPRYGVFGRVLRVVSLAALLASYWLVLRYAPVHAQDDSRLVELVAKVSMNEALDSYLDAALIVQVTEAHGDTPAARARWLAHHSPCVSGRLSDSEAYRRPGNCRWTRNLTTTGRQPRGWTYGRAAWRRMRPRWLAHLDRVRALVRGRDPFRPCELTPVTWDGDVPSWRARAEARGWREARCVVGMENVGYVRAAADAS